MTWDSIWDAPEEFQHCWDQNIRDPLLTFRQAREMKPLCNTSELETSIHGKVRNFVKGDKSIDSLHPLSRGRKPELISLKIRDKR